MPTRPEKPPSWSFGKRFAQLLEREGWTQARLATALGVVDGTVSRWCGGSRAPDPDTLKAICEKVGLSADEILNLDLTGAWPSHEVARLRAAVAAIGSVARDAERPPDAKKR